MSEDALRAELEQIKEHVADLEAERAGALDERARVERAESDLAEAEVCCGELRAERARLREELRAAQAELADVGRDLENARQSLNAPLAVKIVDLLTGVRDHPGAREPFFTPSGVRVFPGRAATIEYALGFEPGWDSDLLPAKGTVVYAASEDRIMSRRGAAAAAGWVVTKSGAKWLAERRFNGTPVRESAATEPELLDKVESFEAAQRSRQATPARQARAESGEGTIAA